MAKIIIDIPDLSYEATMDRKNLALMNDNDIYNMIANGKVIPNNATNGDIIKAMFPKIDKYKNTLLDDNRINILFDDSWWNAPYKNYEEKM